VVIDTLSSMMFGADENKTPEMSTFFANCSQVAREFGCFVLVVHHTGKDKGAGARGAHSLVCDADFVAEVKRKDDVSTLTISKLKDEQSDLTMDFGLTRVEWRRGQELRSSCIVRITKSLRAKKAPMSKLEPTGHKGHLLTIIRNALADWSTPAPEHLGIGSARVISMDQLREAARAAGFVGHDAPEKSTFRTQLGRSLSALAGDKLVWVQDGWIWLLR
jgi:hypothetical protein